MARSFGHVLSFSGQVSLSLAKMLFAALNFFPRDLSLMFDIFGFLHTLLRIVSISSFC